MKYAVSNGLRIEATPKAEGTCPCCGAEMVARCGDLKVWHWAHKSKRVCDHWWESETEWHRAWKDTFPTEWQEVVHFADDGEKHIADIRTPNGFVIEFQHSSIKAEEKLAREQFYKKMVWVVDGRRTKHDFSRFDKNERYWQSWNDDETTYVHYPEWTLPKAWLNRTVPVIFDWGFTQYPPEYEDGYLLPPRESDLICVLPQRLDEDDDFAITATCFRVPRASFYKMVTQDQRLIIPPTKVK